MSSISTLSRSYLRHRLLSFAIGLGPSKHVASCLNRNDLYVAPCRLASSFYHNLCVPSSSQHSENDDFSVQLVGDQFLAGVEIDTEQIDYKQLQAEEARKKFKVVEDEGWDDEIPADKQEEEERAYTQFVHAHCGLNMDKPDGAQRVLLAHPQIRWGRNKAYKKRTTNELQIEEAMTLCRTLPGFRVHSLVSVGTDYSTESKTVWKKGRLEQLRSYIVENNITALMINANKLTALQQASLRSYLQIPVYDRYLLVLWIFKYYARTREARLQIALAELPYVKEQICYMNDKGNIPLQALSLEGQILRNAGNQNRLKFSEVLREREHRLRKSITRALESKNVELDKARAGDQNATVIALIGYTNAGKTSIIKKLTDSKQIFGENRLFATLDTSLHPAFLPSGNKVILADTIGFISDLPISLFASFQATLKHVENADLLVHVEDVAHPNVLAQRENVFQTLNALKIRPALLNTMITVRNKLDRYKMENYGSVPEEEPGSLLISCRTGDGIQDLVKRMDMAVMMLRGSKLRRLKLSPNSKVVPYLYDNGLVTKEPEVSDCGNFLVFDVFMNDQQMAKFQKSVGTKFKAKEKSAQ
ncbi:50S ribosome-binding GTPase domain-containing protein [Ditylenchus destructor]|nr:50S ribosome-binding GTPase domain-containing protein [Ditylenchus destructor]